MEQETRQCTKCKLEKPMKDFCGKRRRCNRCCADAMKEYRKREEGKKKELQYRQANKESMRAKARTPQRRNAPSLRKQWGWQMFKILRINPKDY